MWSSVHLLPLVGAALAASPCQDVLLSACINPEDIIFTDINLSASECQFFCSSFSHCVTFLGQPEDGLCMLVDVDHRQTCQTVGGPSTPMGQVSSVASCLAALSNDPASCDSFTEENCQMAEEPALEFPVGEVTDADTCSVLCSIKEFPFFQFSPSSCQCFTSSSHSCIALGGPPQPPINSCTDSTTTASTSTAPTTTPPADADPVILITGGLAGFDGDESNSTTVLGSSCPVPPLPSPRISHVSVLFPWGVLVCGGSDQLTCLTLDTGRQEWTHHSVMNVRRYISSAVAMPDGVYVLGGLGSMESSSFLPHGYTEWEQGPVMPGSGNYAACAVRVSVYNFMLIGGYPTTKQVVEYNTLTGSWFQWPELEVERHGHSCAVIGGDVVITGGSYASWPKTETTIISISSKQQRAGGEMGEGRERFGLAVLGDRLMAFGGGMSDTIEEWDQEAELWVARDAKLDTTRSRFTAVSIPLSELC